MSQAELAAQSGVSQQTISKIETGKQVDLLSSRGCQIADALMVSPEWLLFGTNDLNPGQGAIEPITADDVKADIDFIPMDDGVILSKEYLGDAGWIRRR